MDDIDVFSVCVGESLLWNVVHKRGVPVNLCAMVDVKLCDVYTLNSYIEKSESLVPVNTFQLNAIQ